MLINWWNSLRIPLQLFPHQYPPHFNHSKNINKVYISSLPTLQSTNYQEYDYECVSSKLVVYGSKSIGSWTLLRVIRHLIQNGTDSQIVHNFANKQSFEKRFLPYLNNVQIRTLQSAIVFDQDFYRSRKNTCSILPRFISMDELTALSSE